MSFQSALKEWEREGRRQEGKRSTEGPTPPPIVLRWAEEEDLREQ